MMRRLIRGLAALVVLLVLLFGAPVALLAWVGNPWPPGGWSEVQLLTNRTVVGAVAVIGWAAWAQMAACIVFEVVSAVRGTAPADLRFVSGGQQQLVRVLVSAVVAASLGGGIGAGALGASIVAVTDAAADAYTPAATTHAEPHIAAHETRTGVPTMTVARDTTMWKLAETHLGDGSRWRELFDLNRGEPLADGTTLAQPTQTISGGSTFRLPVGARPGGGAPAHDSPDRPHRADGNYTVKPADSLWKIADEELDDPTRYMDLYNASTSTVQPGGDRLADPDHIEPGWRITIPGVGGQGHDQTPAQHPDRGNQPPSHPDHDGGSHDDDPSSHQSGAETGNEHRRDQPAQPQARPTPATPTVSDEQPNPPERSTETATAVGDDGGISAVRSLLATAGCLSVGALGLLAVNRRRKFRFRRIGRMIATTSGELADVEQAVVEHGTEAQSDVEFLDRALRYVAAACKVAANPLPQLGAAVLGEDALTLLFTQPAVSDAPTGWAASEDARAWTLPHDTYLESDLDTQPAPYPALVSIGHSESGHTWHLDLETVAMCGIGGTPEQVAGLVRFWAAEMAVNGWAEGCEVLLADEFGAELIGLNPTRLRQVDRSEALARACALAAEMDEVEDNLNSDVLIRRRDGLLLDSTNPVVVVVSSRPQGQLVVDLGDRGRSRVVVVHSDEVSPTVELRSDGTADLPIWGVRIKAFSMSAEQAAPMADLLEATRDLVDEPMPIMVTDGGRLGKYARADGSLREEYTEPRHVEGSDPSSMLPSADQEYLTAAATTTADLASAAPSVPEETRTEVAALDPGLDEDLADWLDESSPRPKLQLLGPVDLHVLNGGDPAAIKNAGGTVSFIAYLACQERGVTGERAAAAFGWKTVNTVHNRATNARFLLGTRPDGTDWLPEAGTSAAARRGTTPTYQLVRDPGHHGVLNTADLFVRLRNRAQRRGDQGCEQDLVAALALVTGAPFEAATDRRFPWLFTGQRHDDILRCAITDTAHLLATRAVAEGRIDLVQLACQAAKKANPHSDVAWLDEAVATALESGAQAAQELLRRHVVERYDEDLPPRTQELLDQRSAAVG